MASILGSCGCGCAGGGCKPVTSNCNFVLRKFTSISLPDITWDDGISDYIKECFLQGGGASCVTGDATTRFSSGLNLCTGEGTLYSYVTLNTDTGDSSSSSPVRVGAFSVQYEDESINWDNISEEPLTDIEKEQKNPPCNFSYNFNFTPEDNADYYIIALPCDEALGHTNVNLTPEGKGYFTSSYNETTKTCSVYPV